MNSKPQLEVIIKPDHPAIVAAKDERLGPGIPQEPVGQPDPAPSHRDLPGEGRGESQSISAGARFEQSDGLGEGGGGDRASRVGADGQRSARANLLREEEFIVEQDLSMHTVPHHTVRVT